MPSSGFGQFLDALPPTYTGYQIWGNQRGSESPSSQLTRSLREPDNANHVTVLNRLLGTLAANKVPGPQLFRLDAEFSVILGEGGQGNVRAVDDKVAARYSNADKKVLSRWPVKLIAIKQHKPRYEQEIRPPPSPGNNRSKRESARQKLNHHLRAAEREVLALSPELWRGSRNIVQLLGWGLCLDTIEDPQSKCCSSVQIPLLVLERADMNLAEFLQNVLFPQEALRSTSYADEASADCVYTLHQQQINSIPRSAWNWLMTGTGFAVDPYETIRGLCMDIGHGLQDLHANNFTHGDLKPQNVLIFKKGSSWIAKLCDFGCARGRLDNEGNAAEHEESVTANSDTATSTEPERSVTREDDATPPGKSTPLHKEQYLGTPTWLPPTDEATAKLDFEGLRKCDLYVYGLVVWSSFCYRGMSLSHNRTVTRVKESLEVLFGNTNFINTTRSTQLKNSISSLLTKTMADRDSRDPTPWTCLYGPSDRAPDPIPTASENANTPTHSPNIGSSNRVLSPDMKIAYREKAWWALPATQPSKAPAMDIIPSSPSHSISDSVDMSETSSVESLEIMEEDGTGPASSRLIANDDDFKSLDVFESSRRREELPQVYKDMDQLLEKWSQSPELATLYCLARFRSRFPLDWWQQDTPGKNMLERVLQTIPDIDICVLAWLCYGPVGELEVRTLSQTRETWKAVLDSSPLDESQRLDRFLLLMQFGARVDKNIGGASSSASLTDWYTICSVYFRSCRPETQPTVFQEISRIFQRVNRLPHIPGATKTFMRKFLNKQKSVLPKAKTINTDFDHESTPLLHQDLLPIGWREHGMSNSRVTVCYEEELTQSMTLRRPKLSIQKLRQLKIGFLNKKRGSCQLDLGSYMYPASQVHDRDVSTPESVSRFPFYNESWFFKESSIELPSENILGKIRRKETRTPQITSFSVRLPELGLLDLIQDFFEALFSFLKPILLLVGFIIGLIAFKLLVVVITLIFLPVLIFLLVLLILCGLCYLILCVIADLEFEPVLLAVFMAGPSFYLCYLMLKDGCSTGAAGEGATGEVCRYCWYKFWTALCNLKCYRGQCVK